MSDVEEESSSIEDLDKEVTKVISISNVQDLSWVLENKELLKKHGFMIDTGLFKQGLINNPQSSTNSQSTKHRNQLSKTKTTMHDDVFVEIMEQPQQRGLRFRYECESRFGGSIHGEKSVPTKKTFPTIKIHSYVGTAVIVVSCVTKDAPYKPHPHNLVGKNCRRGVCTIKVTDSNIISFPHLSIQCAKKKDIFDNLKQRQDINVDPFLSGFKHIDTAINIDRNVVRLCFQVFIPDDNGKITRIIAPVVSHPIYDKKSLNELMICRVSKSSGSAKGGDEIFLLCEKINREDIDVRFYKTAKGGAVEWEDFGLFSSYDIHRQYAIVFKTPPYKDKYISKPVEVHMQLMCKNSTDCSDPVQYVYMPEDPDPDSLIKLKKRKVDHLKQFGLYSESDSMFFPKVKQSASKLKQKGETSATAVQQTSSVTLQGGEMEDESKAELQKDIKMTDEDKSGLQSLMERMKKNISSTFTVNAQIENGGKVSARKGLRSGSRNKTGRQRSHSRSEDKTKEDISEMVSRHQPGSKQSTRTIRKDLPNFLDSLDSLKVPIKAKRKASEDLLMLSNGRGPKKLDKKDTGKEEQEDIDVKTTEIFVSEKVQYLEKEENEQLKDVEVNDKIEHMDHENLQMKLLDQTQIARSLKSKAKIIRNVKSTSVSNRYTSDKKGNALQHHLPDMENTDNTEISTMSRFEASKRTSDQTSLLQIFSDSPSTDDVRLHHEMKLEELMSLLTQNLLTLMEEINPITLLDCIRKSHPEVVEYLPLLKKLRSRKQRAVRFLLELLINHREWIPTFWDAVSVEYENCYELILSKEEPPSLHLPEHKMCSSCAKKAFDEFIGHCNFIPEELLLQLLQREVLEAEEVLLLNSCSNEQEKIKLLRKFIETDNIPWIKFVESVCPLPEKEADKLKRIIDRMDFLPCIDCERAYSIMKCLCKNENGNITQGSKVLNLKLEDLSSKEVVNKIAVFTLNVDERSEEIVETILAKKEIINSSITEYGVIENAWCGSVIIVLKLTNQNGEISKLEDGILKIVTKIFEDDDIKSHLSETELDMEVTVANDDECFFEDMISKKIAIMSNFALLQEELDIKNFMDQFETKGIMKKEEFMNKFSMKKLLRKQRTLHFLEFILKSRGEVVQIFFDILEQDDCYECLRNAMKKCAKSSKTNLANMKENSNSDSFIKETVTCQESTVQLEGIQGKASDSNDSSLKIKVQSEEIFEKDKQFSNREVKERSLNNENLKKTLKHSAKTQRQNGTNNNKARQRLDDDNNSCHSVIENDSVCEISRNDKVERSRDNLSESFHSDNLDVLNRPLAVIRNKQIELPGFTEVTMNGKQEVDLLSDKDSAKEIREEIEFAKTNVNFLDISEEVKLHTDSDIAANQKVKIFTNNKMATDEEKKLPTNDEEGTDMAVTISVNSEMADTEEKLLTNENATIKEIGLSKKNKISIDTEVKLPIIEMTTEDKLELPTNNVMTKDTVIQLHTNDTCTMEEVELSQTDDMNKDTKGDEMVTKSGKVGLSRIESLCTSEWESKNREQLTDKTENNDTSKLFVAKAFNTHRLKTDSDSTYLLGTQGKEDSQVVPNACSVALHKLEIKSHNTTNIYNFSFKTNNEIQTKFSQIGSGNNIITSDNKQDR